ncbi:alpha/beta fold hydrolase [Dyadobacter arcticus]|uniref:Pimeloyl-ACP methyl ester carboxylesterase n=1 Tax=Dyadobacter arcticus TaxID=1078754 RepID=A0ABX0UWF5_9BACT|nr:alpha/beta fold hydrolase [Dyadobacter arcticus]NIJ55930.1 pimeloyl-ACP methyl ester carboxylesterase [Dyadobacter arcticus]
MRLHYHKLGHGPNILLAFHGIGQDGVSCFKTFEETLGQHYTIYAFNLFFHGKSTGINLDSVTKSIWAEIIKDFVAENNITHFDIAGFSMGGRFALATIEAFPEKIQNAFLIAPDGVSEHAVYFLATRFQLGRRLFKWSMRHSNTFFKVANALKSIGLLNDSLVRFTRNVLDTPEKRQTVYKSWTAFRPLRFNIPAVYKLAKENNIRIFLITGRFDKLLKMGAVKPLSRLLPEKQNVILKSGHSQLVAQTGVWICTLFE